MTTTDFDAAFERDLRWALAARAPLSIPASLGRPGILNGPAPRPIGIGRRLARVAGMGLAASAGLVVIALVSMSVLGARPIDRGSGAGAPHALSWGTQMALLQADDLTIEVGGQAYRAPRQLEVHSDPGTATYRTLEMSWRDGGVEMRLYIYLAADNSTWWVSGIRTYDGTSPGEWIYYVTPQIRAALGASFDADVDVLGVGIHGIGRLHIDGMRLSSFTAGSVPRYAAGCRIAGPVHGGGLGPVVSQINPLVEGVSLVTGMDANAAQAELAAHGVCTRFHFEYPASNMGQIWCNAPPGNVREWAFASDGGLILFVEAPRLQRLPPGSPQVVGC